MFTGTECSIRSLSKDDGEIIIDGLASTKLALECLYESGVGQFPREDVLDDLMKIVEISERIKSTDNLEEKINIFLCEYQKLSHQIKTKYSDFLPKRVLRKIEVGEKYAEGLKKLLIAQRYMLQAFDDIDIVDQARKLYTGIVMLSEVLEYYIPYFPVQLIEIIKNAAIEILADPSLQPEQFKLPLSATNYLIALKNTTRGVLWQLENDKKEKKHTVGELLDWLETAPGWAGDDFEECLEYVNRVRK